MKTTILIQSNLGKYLIKISNDNKNQKILILVKMKEEESKWN